MTEVSSPTRALAELAASCRWEDVAPDVRERVLFAVRDALACAVGGSRTDLARLHRTAFGVSGTPEASLIGTGHHAPAPAAAYHNATAVNAMDAIVGQGQRQLACGGGSAQRAAGGGRISSLVVTARRARGF